MIEELTEKISDFINSKNKVITLPYLPIINLVLIFQELEFTANFEDIDTNGWQIDFWWKIEKDNINYTLSGSWYYGNYQLSKD